jgi:hypothetical protein
MGCRKQRSTRSPSSPQAELDPTSPSSHTPSERYRMYDVDKLPMGQKTLFSPPGQACGRTCLIIRDQHLIQRRARSPEAPNPLEIEKETLSSGSKLRCGGLRRQPKPRSLSNHHVRLTVPAAAAGRKLSTSLTRGNCDRYFAHHTRPPHNLSFRVSIWTGSVRQRYPKAA